MSTLLMHIAGSRVYNFTLFRPHLYIYDDRVVYKKRHILTHDEFSISYNHIAQVNLIRFIYLFAHVEIATTGMRFIKVHWVMKGKAKQAKKIIDEKVHQSHIKDQPSPDGNVQSSSIYVKDYELSLKRLKELQSTGKITKGEFNKKRKHLLKKHY